MLDNHLLNDRNVMAFSSIHAMQRSLVVVVAKEKETTIKFHYQ